MNSNFDFMFNTDDDMNTCSDEYPGPSPDSAEVRAVMQFANEINLNEKEYAQVNFVKRLNDNNRYDFSEFT